jgi:hypothetical protein
MMSEPILPLCAKDDPRIPVVVTTLRKSVSLPGGSFALDARRILAALDRAESNAPARSPVTAATETSGGAGEAQEGSQWAR